MKKRYLFILPSEGFGGVEMSMLALGRHYRDLGASVDFVFPLASALSPLVSACQSENFGMLFAPIAPAAAASRLEATKHQEAALTGAVDLAKYDFFLVGAPAPHVMLGMLNCLAASGKPGLVRFGLVGQYYSLSLAERDRLLSAVRPWFRYVCVSHFTRERLANCLALDGEPSILDVIENGAVPWGGAETAIDPGTFVSRPGAKCIAVAGRLHQQKGDTVLIAALPEILATHPEARIIWFGEGDRRQVIEKRARELGVQHAFYLAGQVDQNVVRAVFRGAHLVVVPTLYEGLSNALLEAIQCGSAIVATNAAGQDKILTDGVNALIAEAGDSASLARCIVNALAEPAATERRRKALAKIAPHYTQDRMFTQYDDLLEHAARAVRLSDAAVFQPSEICDVQLDITKSLVEWSLANDRNSVALSDFLKSSRAPGCRKLRLVVTAGSDKRSASGATIRCGSGDLLVELARSATHCEATQVACLLLEQIVTSLETHPFDLELERAELIAETVVQLGLKLGAGCEELVKRAGGHLAKSDAANAAISAGLAEISFGRRYTVQYQDLDPHALRHSVRLLGPGIQPLAGIPDPTALEKLPTFANQRADSAGRPVALCFAHNLNYPQRNGGDQRIMSMVQDYRGLGYDVVLLTCTSNRMMAEKRLMARALSKDLGIRTFVYCPEPYREAVTFKAFDDLRNGNLDFSVFFDERLLEFCQQVIELVAPSVFHINYAYFSWLTLAAAGSRARLVLDSHDLISRRVALVNHIVSLNDVLPRTVDDVTARVFAPDQFAALQTKISEEEISAFRQFDLVLSISEFERQIIASAFSDIPVEHLGMRAPHLPAIEREVNASPRAIYVGGDNVFNLLGLGAITNFIAPYLGLNCGDFSCQVVGKVGRVGAAHDRVEFTGFLHSIDPVYSSADFSICPIPCGTGQNIKIVESLSRGVPVVAFSHLGETGGVRHDENGLIASDIFVMREMIAELLNNPTSRRRLRKGAMETARSAVSSLEDFARCLSDKGIVLP